MFSIIVGTCLLALVSGDPIRNYLHRPPFRDIRKNFSNFGIIGGEPAKIEDHPWQASIRANGSPICGGSIISKNIILTAASCAEYEASELTVRVGSSDKNRGGELIQVAQTILHEQFFWTDSGIPVHDVALLMLSRPINFSDKAKTIELFGSEETVDEGIVANLTGWGTLEEDGPSPDILYYVDEPVVSKTSCSEAYSAYGGIPKGQICAGSPQGGRGACMGDGGSPLVINKRQAGIASWGNGCARKGFPGVYTEIAAFRDWIKEHAQV
ncbi:hypothetical protein QAD02_008896 [Eretmocerus hayati]|uniref:Uncharacterized protein n=1 Tax=Eretmocerus hayati TaxID=131215 RepID=A0ACC2NA75_9HYME|nr:hypothetical protein QAD02_008896 [Eretmocerus hayati]